MFGQHELAKMHCGLIACSIWDIGKLMPEILPVIYRLDAPLIDLIFDVKVHMLMPEQYPCIPNWHCDFVPRDKDGNKLINDIDTSQKMYLWLSGSPLTEFKTEDVAASRTSIETVVPLKWHEFDQTTIHRGTKSDQHQWRMFIRAAPREIYPEKAFNYKGIRRHAQVYCDPSTFTW